jgi:hypothetical protein
MVFTPKMRFLHEHHPRQMPAILGKTCLDCISVRQSADALARSQAKGDYPVRGNDRLSPMKLLSADDDA